MKSSRQAWPAVLAMVVALPACAALDPDAAPARQDPVPEAAAAAASAPTGFPPKPVAEAPAPKPFAEIIRGATRSDGLFPIWRKDEKVWLEVPKAMVGKPFLFTANIANSVGERGLYASQMGIVHLAEVRVIGRQFQLLALNTKYRADAYQGSKRAIDQAFSPSLLGSGAVASAEHPQRKSVLVDASFLFSDIPRYSTRLEAAYRLPFAVDRANSSFARSKSRSASVHDFHANSSWPPPLSTSSFRCRGPAASAGHGSHAQP